MIRNNATTAEEVSNRLDVLAAKYNVWPLSYDDRASEQMSEFDALKWSNLVAQRRALMRESVQSSVAVIGTIYAVAPVRLSNHEAPEKLAA